MKRVAAVLGLVAINAGLLAAWNLWLFDPNSAPLMLGLIVIVNLVAFERVLPHC